MGRCRPLVLAIGASLLVPLPAAATDGPGPVCTAEDIAFYTAELGYVGTLPLVDRQIRRRYGRPASVRVLDDGGLRFRWDRPIPMIVTLDRKENGFYDVTCNGEGVTW